MALGTSSVALPPSENPGRVGQRTLLSLVLLSGGHFFIDLYSSALGAIQPYLVERLHLSLSEVGVLGGLMILFNSVLQPAYGYLSDRLHTRIFATLAPAVTAVFISLLPVAPSYGVLVALVVAGGSAIAAFHPQATAMVTRAAVHRGRSMAVFITAGTLGLAVGPAYFDRMLRATGTANPWWAAVPGVLCSLALIVWLPKPAAAASQTLRRAVDFTEMKAVRRPLVVLYFLVFIRSVVQGTYAQFLPLYLHRERGYTITDANYLLSVYLGVGAIGGFLGGHLADRFGGRRIIMISMIGSVPLMALFFLTGGWLAVAGLLAGGLVLLFTIPVNVVMAQELAPKQAGTVSALLMGFAWGMSGLIFIPMTGMVADHLGLHTALQALLLFPVAGFGLATLLPKLHPKAQASDEI